MKNNHGIAHIIIILATVVVLGGGITVYRIMTNNNEDSKVEITKTNGEPVSNEFGANDEPDSIDEESANTSNEQENNQTSGSQQEDNDSNTTTNTNSSSGNSSNNNEQNNNQNDPPVQKKSFTVDAFNFGYSMSTINVSPGDEVTITLTNSGGNHDWVVDEINGAATEIISGSETVSITFTVPQSAAGKTYGFYCSVGNHRAQGMEGSLVVAN